MSQRTTNLSHAALGLAAIALLGWLLRWLIDASGASPRDATRGLSFAAGAGCLTVAGLSFALAEPWPVRIGGLGLLLGLGLIVDLPPAAWLGILFLSVCLILAVAVARKLGRG